ncbi:MAG: hypothetical protein P1P67_05755, partial [Treponema phagedenis]
ELIKEENLKDGSIRFIEKSINKGYVETAGTDLDSLLPPISRKQGAREAKKKTVLQRIGDIVKVFIGI